MTVFSWLREDQRTVLESSSIQVKWELGMKTWDGTELPDATDCLVLSGSYIGRDATQPIQGTGHLVLCEPFDWKNTLACPRVILKDNDSPAEMSWNMGTWTFRESGRSLEDTQLWEVEIADVIDALGVQTGVSWTVRDGVNIGEAVAAVIREPYFAMPFSLPKIPWEVSADAVWPITEKSRWIDIANELLEASAHASLYADRHGVLTTYPWRPLTEVSPVWRFQEDLKICWLREDCFREPPPASTPNKWIGINRSVDNPSEGAGVFTIDDSGSCRLIPRVFEANASDQSTLVSLVRQARQDSIMQGNRLNLRMGLNPVFWHGDVVEVSLPDLDAGSVTDPVFGMVVGWRMAMDDSDMTTIVETVQ